MYSLMYLNLTLATGGLVLLVATVALWVDYIAFRGKYFSAVVGRFFWPIVILTTVSSVILSLVYSEYFGFIPCSLCWLQRIAIYPQALLAVTAFVIKDSYAFPKYGIGLSLLGFAVALYQYVYQMMPAEATARILPCLADGSADCADKVIDMYGFVTFAFLSAVTFAFLTIIYCYKLRINTSQ